VCFDFLFSKVFFSFFFPGDLKVFVFEVYSGPLFPPKFEIFLIKSLFLLLGKFSLWIFFFCIPPSFSILPSLGADFYLFFPIFFTVEEMLVVPLADHFFFPHHDHLTVLSRVRFFSLFFRRWFLSHLSFWISPPPLFFRLSIDFFFRSHALPAIRQCFPDDSRPPPPTHPQQNQQNNNPQPPTP